MLKDSIALIIAVSFLTTAEENRLKEQHTSSQDIFKNFGFEGKVTCWIYVDMDSKTYFRYAGSKFNESFYICAKRRQITVPNDRTVKLVYIEFKNEPVQQYLFFMPFKEAYFELFLSHRQIQHFHLLHRDNNRKSIVIARSIRVNIVESNNAKTLNNSLTCVYPFKNHGYVVGFKHQDSYKLLIRYFSEYICSFHYLSIYQKEGSKLEKMAEYLGSKKIAVISISAMFVLMAIILPFIAYFTKQQYMYTNDMSSGSQNDDEGEEPNESSSLSSITE